MFSTDDIYMQRALELAAKGAGFVSPNPLVGAVLVHDDVIIGEGYHACFGQAHAEVNCLSAVSAENKHLISASTMYVTLEPCSHHGKTPPCAERLIKEGIRKVVIAVTDPNPVVHGAGINLLKQAGIDVRVGVMEQAAAYQNRRFFTSFTQQRPYITLKWAQSADGFIGSGTDERIKITCNEADIVVHQWRSEEDAIMIGRRTALLDDPSLTTRLVEGKSPLRIVLDRNNSLPKSLKIFNDGKPLVIINGEKEGVDGPVMYKKITNDAQFWKSLMVFLDQQKIQGLMVEGGRGVISAMISAGYWDEARVFTNPALNLHQGTKAPVLQDTYSIQDQQQIGRDLLNVYLNKGQ
ncbi:MAG: bifunctional diaminohydroxyphosphoribosylaminopyrimidine deaminase/5-amino-6-(5-phosphoribosylamino)uracil reductase RibD [bacterium]